MSILPAETLELSHHRSASTVPASSLAPPRGRRHRHRRSAAISGDFDLKESGIAGPPRSLSVPSSPTRQEPRLVSRTADLPPFATLAARSQPDLSRTTNSTLSPITITFDTDNDPVQPRSPTNFFVTEQSRFSSSPDIPDAVIDLDDVLDSKRQSVPVLTPTGTSSSSLQQALALRYHPALSRRAANSPSTSPDLEPFGYPKHSLFYSPKKSEVSIAEEIAEEECGDGLTTPTTDTYDDAKSAKSSSSRGSNMSTLKSTLLAQANLSTNSLCSDKAASQAHTLSGAASLPSLRGKVRYQSYFQTQQKVASPNMVPQTLSTSAPGRSRSPARVRFQEPVSRRRKSPFEYRPRVYEVTDADDLFEELRREKAATVASSGASSGANSPNRSSICVGSQLRAHDKLRLSAAPIPELAPPPAPHSHHETSSELSSTSPSISPVSTSPSSSVSPSPRHRRGMSSMSFVSLSLSKDKSSPHHRSGSIISSLSARLHHRRGSSTFSLHSLRRRSSPIQAATDELLGLRLRDSDTIPINKSTLSLASTAGSGATTTQLRNISGLSDETTLADNIGEPGPLVDHHKALSNISNRTYDTDSGAKLAASPGKRRKGFFNFLKPRT